MNDGASQKTAKPFDPDEHPLTEGAFWNSGYVKWWLFKKAQKDAAAKKTGIKAKLSETKEQRTELVDPIGRIAAVRAQITPRQAKPSAESHYAPPAAIHPTPPKHVSGLQLADASRRARKNPLLKAGFR